MSINKIAIIDYVGLKAGIDIYNMNLLDGLHACNYSTYVFSNFDSKQSNTKVHNIFRNTNVSKVKAIANNFFGYIKAYRICKREKVEWTIMHLFRGGFFDLVIMLIAQWMGLKIILIVHDVESLDAKALSFTRRIILKRLNQWMVVHNQFSYTALKSVLPDKYMQRVHVIKHGNFVDLPNSALNRQTAIEHFKLNPDKKYVLFFGQIKKVKGLDLLLEAVPNCKSDFEIIIAGKLRMDNYERYQEIIDQHQYGNRVHAMIRHISDYERELLFKVAELIVIPYRLIFQSGVLIMAMSFNTPVLASDLDPNKEIIEHGRNGMLFKSGDSMDLAKQLDSFLSGELNERDIKAEAMRTMTEEFGWHKIAKQYHSILLKS